MKSRSGQLGICLLVYLIAGFLGSCTETVTQKEAEAFAAPSEKLTDSVPLSDPSYAVVDSISVTTAIEPEFLPFNGRLFSALSWRDKLGRNYLILSEKGSYDHGNGRKELFAYHYLKRNTSYDRLWQMNDFVDGVGCDLNIELIHFFPLVSDIDSNGIAETAIFYSLDNRCDASIFTAKLIVHEGAHKFVIRGVRGQFLGPPEAVLNEYRAANGLPPTKYKNLDTAYATMASSIIDFYSQQWDEFIATENELEGNLPDSLIKAFN